MTDKRAKVRVFIEPQRSEFREILRPSCFERRKTIIIM